jgi:SEC-C motif-containing protein
MIVLERGQWVNGQMMCYCHSQKKFSDCCQPYLEGESAESPEILMRSRYSAYCLKNFDYLRETTDPQALGSIDHRANQEWAESVEFIKLEILKAEEEKNKGIVEFKATFKEIGKDEIHVHHEHSKFRKQQGLWYFREGRVIAQ